MMIQKVAAIALMATCLAVAGCNTVRGAAQDVVSAANCTENAIHGGVC